jgi:hypothetical protein
MTTVSYPVSQSLESSDYQGAAAMFVTTDGYSRMKAAISKGGINPDVELAIVSPTVDIKLDLIIENVQFSIADISQISPHMGDTFSMQFLGRDIPVATFSGKLSMLHGFNTKRVFMLLYSDVFRLSRVARFKVVPHIYFNFPAETTISGAFLNLKIGRTSRIGDFAQVSFQMLVFRHQMTNEDNVSGITDLDTRYSIPSTVLDTTEVPDTPDSSGFAGNTDQQLIIADAVRVVLKTVGDFESSLDEHKLTSTGTHKASTYNILNSGSTISGGEW